MFCNNPNAGIIQRLEPYDIDLHLFNRDDMGSGQLTSSLLNIHPDLIVLAGFLWLIPSSIIQAFDGRIINIHPALLPKYGGKGMYGMRVHEAVIQAHEKESGISIHLVDEHYDEGNIIFQSRCPVFEDDTPETLAQRVHSLEYQHFPEVIYDYLNRIGPRVK